MTKEEARKIAKERELLQGIASIGGTLVGGIPELPSLRSINRWMDEALKDIVELHTRKAHDYATNDNPFLNFEDVANAVGTDVDTVFRQFIAVKLARLKNLLGSGKTPNNESIDDTRMDLAVYALLYLAYSYREKEIADDKLASAIAKVGTDVSSL